NAAAPAFADAVAAELRDVGMGEGEFVCELRERDEPGATGADEAVFRVRPNAGLPFGPAAETASGGELSRIALAIAAVAGGDTLVFDEIDAGIGGETAHAVGGLLRRLAEHAQVVTIPHLPQLAAVAPGALWQVEGPNRASLLVRRPQLSGTLLVLDVVPQRRLAFQLSEARLEARLELEPAEDQAAATLTVDAPRFAGVGRAFPSQ